ncbi:uncharacterized protein LOC124916008 [Impatiens glandulifera]|uniref:uncharacterized protein LOC124916008 n=1 Tax=Impatiens glandulifera TaxID=253017 RepID=UPI001FB0DE3F|nr:uncharacterized protein LOC124916008 [Impatiens glandulifera]
MVAVVVTAQPPGILIPSNSHCDVGKFKICKNLVHVCPKFCGPSGGCTTECQSCKPICNDGSFPPPESDNSPPITHSPPPPSSTPTPTTTHSPSPPSSTPTPSTHSPPKGSGKKKSKCKNKNSECYNVEYVCPEACPGGCQVDCKSCKPVCNCDKPGAVCQDPRFIGADGITFYFHGKKDREFCLVSDTNLHINGHFIGKRDPTMTRDFTWVESIGILFNNHKMFLGAKKTAAWDDLNDRLAITFDGEPIFLQDREGASWQPEYSSQAVSITRIASSANSVVVEVEGNFRITVKVVPITEEDSRVHNYGITKDDCFAHLDLSFKFLSLSGDVDGVLGRTYASDYVSKVNMSKAMPVVGGEKEFITSSLFAADCSASRFVGEQKKVSSGLGMEFPSLSCGGDHIEGGAGVVCKR